MIALGDIQVRIKEKHQPTLLLLPGLVADGRADGDGLPGGLRAPLGADEDAEAGLLQDVDVVVVGVAHGPAGGVLAGLLAARGVHEAAVAVGPVVECVQVLRKRYHVT